MSSREIVNFMNFQAKTTCYSFSSSFDRPSNLRHPPSYLKGSSCPLKKRKIQIRRKTSKKINISACPSKANALFLFSFPSRPAQPPPRPSLRTKRSIHWEADEEERAVLYDSTNSLSSPVFEWTPRPKKAARRWRCVLLVLPDVNFPWRKLIVLILAWLRGGLRGEYFKDRSEWGMRC